MVSHCDRFPGPDLRAHHRGDVLVDYSIRRKDKKGQMDTLSNDLRADGCVLAMTLIESARAQSAAVASGEVAQMNFIGEFAVMCEVGFGVLAVRNSKAELLRQAFDEELCRFNPNHLQLLENRLESYFKVLTGVRRPEDIGPKLSKVLATHIGSNVEIASWASGMFAEALALFFELADSHSKGMRRA